MAFQVGDAVKISGLQTRTDLNNLCGLVIARKGSRYGVRLFDGSEVSVGENRNQPGLLRMVSADKLFPQFTAGDKVRAYGMRGSAESTNGMAGTIVAPGGNGKWEVPTKVIHGCHLVPIEQTLSQDPYCMVGAWATPALARQVNAHAHLDDDSDDEFDHHYEEFASY